MTKNRHPLNKPLEVPYSEDDSDRDEEIMINTSFRSLPLVLAMYFKAGIKRNAKQIKYLPELTLKVTGFEINPLHLQQYLETFDYENITLLPAPYLYLACNPIALYMVTLPEFPLSPIGMVHLGVHFEQPSELHLISGQNFDVVISITNQRDSIKGLVFDIETCFYASDGKLCIKITNTFLARTVKNHSDAPVPDLYHWDDQETQYKQRFESTFMLAGNAGRRYAKLSGDYNPIHLSRWSAALFGFKRPIIHGIYIVSKAYAQLSKQYGVLPLDGVFQFRSPLYLPGQAELTLQSKADYGSVLVSSADKTHLQGRVVL